MQRRFGHAAESADDAGSRGAAPLGIHVKPRIRSEFKKIAAGIEEKRDALARGEALLGVLGFDGLCAAAFADGRLLLAERSEQGEHGGRVGLLALRRGVEFGGERGVERGSWLRVLGTGHRKLASIAGTGRSGDCAFGAGRWIRFLWSLTFGFAAGVG